ncbi:conserved Plasmodium protein, unknown function [Plasmodium berghei]|uniref:Uncharacterized protein n=3 Tax=Plasmodium berghei TaxID=5821 RepID=A0A509AIZ5_PLABA|nr:conserved Plasmodium protein, unknown function [Plasmodium berghei ANKA]CXI28827.1 conserved Plasmodium protein, unknown function [Plasmodium berghei]SCM20625.1 conserved Plasmodium protein, unknown function [Plasmodium berghei]SCN24230.1 conserved Plasmodium protein, unknown function [Plasmodium berghei]SCO59442.1 conserved Plasmodium protein, unknown function [Plasmodium berghei]VUC55168.1 conserved Plasmodium protein, unknown function [Plasmodium berghei ANKA]|eukprot:XP_034420981.1 conserved Plasmodium protein, unknown function [Plasmodium berghei ANKA]
MINFFSFPLKMNVITRKKCVDVWNRKHAGFSSKKICMLNIKTIKDMKKMICYIENIYSNGNNEKKDSYEAYFGNNDVIGFLYKDSNFEKIYNEWNKFHFKNKSEVEREENAINGNKDPNYDNNTCKHLSYVFQLCSNENGEISIMKKNIIGIYIPENININSINANYFYIFKNLKDLMDGKIIYELYLILPNCVFLLSFINIFKELIYYEKIIEFIEMKERKIGKKESIKKIIKNNILRRVYKYRKNTLKGEMKNALEKVFSQKKYIKIIYEDSVELSSFLYKFLKINLFNIIDLHHLYHNILSMYELKILKNSIYQVISILFPDIYNKTIFYEYKQFPSMDEKYRIGINMNGYKKRKKYQEKQKKYLELGKGDPSNVNKKYNKPFQCKKQIMSVYKCADNNNELLNYEKQLVHILYIFPCTHKLLSKYKDLEGYNICYKMNELIEKYISLFTFRNKILCMKSAKLFYNDNIIKKHINEASSTEFYQNNYEKYNDKLITSLYNKLNINEEIIYNHHLTIGSNLYAYIYEKNKCTKNIIFRFNLNSKNISFKNILSQKYCSIYDKNNRRISIYKNLLKNVNNNIFSNASPTLVNRNKTIYNYKNNILVGYLNDKENDFHFFDDKNIGDVVLCNIRDISSCGKYLYLERFDKQNLIFHFRKKKYVNLERNYDYDDINKLDRDMLKEIT